jgi:outer membrane lipoprotein-sorting protein
MADPELLSYRDEATAQTAGTYERHRTLAPEVPERPALAPGVELVGEMQGTGFTDRQWLIVRDGRFIQLTEILYRIAELADGRRNWQEIAAGVTQSTDWTVSADNVRHLILAKLMPLGLIAAADGLAASREASAGESRARSPLLVNMRLKALSSRIIDPITEVLQVLFARLVLIPILVAVALAHWWLYQVHGVAASVSDALYTPGGLILILGLVILAGIFHEFGHASALRYGGGKVRGMGVGLYLVYPTFYTDVTDSYRLGRWARVRTDLGGVYFHMIFTLGLIIFSAVSGWDLPSFAVLLIDLQVVCQFLPFVRFDGYWMLADLTGIPDLFSLTGPFLRGWLSVPGWSGSKLPGLRTWVKIVFALYIVTTIPLLAYLYYLMIWRLPRLLTRTYEALTIQTRMLPNALRRGEFLTLVLSGTQLLLLSLSILGTLYIIYGLVRAPVKAVWVWSRPTGTRRLAGAVGTAAVAALVVFLWVPHWADLSQVDRLLTRARESTARLQSLTADLEGSIGPERFTGTMILRRPNLARIDLTGQELGTVTIVSDGNSGVTYFKEQNQFTEMNPGPDGRNVFGIFVDQVDYFFRPESIGVVPSGGRSAYVGKMMAGGGEYDVVDLSMIFGSLEKTTRYLISAQDHLIHEVVTTTGHDGKKGTSRVTLNSLRIDVPIDDSTFQWTPPPSAVPLQMPKDFMTPMRKGLRR